MYWRYQPQFRELRFEIEKILCTENQIQAIITKIKLIEIKNKR